MNFSTTKVDFTTIPHVDLYYASIEMVPMLKVVYPRDICRGEEKTPKYSAALAVVTNGAIARDVYSYLVAQYKTVQRLLSTKVVNHVTDNGGEVCGVDHVKGTCVIEDTCSMGMKEIREKYESQDLDKTFPSCYENTVDTKGPGVVIGVGKSAIITPVVLGDPVFTPKAISVLEAEGIEVTPIKSLEVKVAHMVVDTVRVAQGKIVPKKIQKPLTDVYGPALCDAVTSASLLAMGTFSGHIKGSLKGRELLDRVLKNMVDNRKAEGYNETLKQFGEIYDKKRDVLATKMLGNYQLGTQEYAKTILEQTRGLRGADDRDSTGCGISCYLPINAPRSIVKSVLRVMDVMHILRCFPDDNREVSFIGSGAEAFVNALWVFNARLKYVGSANPKRLGWEFVDGVYSCKDIQFVMGTTIRGVVINTDICEKDGVSEREYVQMINLPPRIKTDDILPSVAPHSLHGYLLPTGASYERLKLEFFKPLYFSMSVTVNLMRTFPSFFNGMRPYDLLRKKGFPTADLSSFVRIGKNIQKIGHQVLAEVAGFGQDVEFLDSLTPAERLEIVSRLPDKIPSDVAPAVEIVADMNSFMGNDDVGSSGITSSDLNEFF